MAKMHAVFYRYGDGMEPVDEFIGRLNVKRQVAIDNQIDRLNDVTDNSPPLPFPHSSQVEGELRELRCHYGKELYRILYRRSNNLFVLLHILRKSTGRIPAQDIELAQQRWADFRARMNARVRRPPRAAGRDAPPSRSSPS
jgi:phage-related protein